MKQYPFVFIGNQIILLKYYNITEIYNYTTKIPNKSRIDNAKLKLLQIKEKI